ncbi:zona pellucida glycoprotein 2, like 2 [Denticeps clupeoides]|uniref:zona pellucida glycoprotein 2, like 2 n=1 Tax=Denticeps clupeoides TaxID=299321 RepID=UPI0010A45D60|nr:zona pellucida sperm-binding protein 4-like [Denticeps clupeoides]
MIQTPHHLRDPATQFQTKGYSDGLCQVRESDRVPCGDSSATRANCESVNCCFDGRQCYYGSAVTLQCTRDGQFVIVVAKDVTLPELSLDSLRLLEGSGGPCVPIDSNAAFVIYQFPFTSCGTTVKEEHGYIVYENIMFSTYEVGIGPRGSITRDSSFELYIQCRYSDTAVEALVLDVNPLPPPSNVALGGPLRVALRLANGPCTTKGCSNAEVYSSFYTDMEYPVTKVLREPVYVEVHILERTDPNIVLLLDHCWATSTQDPLSQPQWDLLIDGCPYNEDHYLTTVVPVDSTSGLQFPTHYKRFVMKMFTFVQDTSLLPLETTVFIHCSTSVCLPSASEPCQQACRSRKQRSLADRKDSMERVVVTSGKVIMIAALYNRSQVDDASSVLPSEEFGLMKRERHLIS